MDSYTRLSTFINKNKPSLKNVQLNNNEKNLLKNQYKNLELFTWNLNLINNDFKLISINYGYECISISNFKKFIFDIKSSFREYFIDFFHEFYSFLKNQTEKNIYQDYSLKSVIPYKLTNEYFFASLNIHPVIKNNHIIEFNIIMIPVKKYFNETPTFIIYNNHTENTYLTSLIKKKISITNKILTNKQFVVFNFLIKGYSSKKIAAILNKSQETIFKFNVRIKERLSIFFDLKFNNVNDAVNYFKSSFLSN